MDNNELHKLLDQLHQEIENTQAVDEKGRELLRDLGEDITELLERTEGASEKLHPSFFGNMEDTITHFEVSHPGLTTLISKLAESLSNAGI